MKINRLARGMAWGAVLAGLDAAYTMLREASNYTHVMDDKLRSKLCDIQVQIVAVQRAAWIAYDKERKS